MRAERAQQVVINPAQPVVCATEFLLTSGRQLDDVTPTVRRIAAARDQRALLELVEQSDDIAWIQAERVRERLLTRRAAFAEQIQRDEVPWAKAARLGHGVERPSADTGEVLEQREESLICWCLRPGFGHALNNT